MEKIVKQLMIILILLGIGGNQVQASVTDETLGYQTLARSTENLENLYTVTAYQVIDGDTADFTLDRTESPNIKARFLLIDAPELAKGVPYGKAAKKRVISLLEAADIIQVEYEGVPQDQNGRDLVHVWVDGILLEEILVHEGFAIARYIQAYIPDSKYATYIYQAQEQARYEGNRVWVDGAYDFISQAEFAPVVAVQTGAQAVGFAETQAITEVYYKNCKEVKAAGAAPIYPGDPGFRPQFDKDNDGIGCEK